MEQKLLTYFDEDTYRIFLPEYETLVAYITKQDASTLLSTYGKTAEEIAYDYFTKLIDSSTSITCPNYILLDIAKELGIPTECDIKDNQLDTVYRYVGTELISYAQKTYR